MLVFIDMARMDDSLLVTDFDNKLNGPINFIENRFHYLSPFSAHEVVLAGVVYKTAEHAYQALRMKAEHRDRITVTTSPLAAWREAQHCKKEGLVDPRHDKDDLMEEIFRAKLDQHQDIEDVLRESGDRELRKVYDTDYYWGTGADGSGENMMGKLWMKLRGELE
ncbi:MAG: ribA/ribD-fused uncharacterized protein [Patiriisocius sp.]|jgi:ribA/ribD-fused uncharacterized protein